MEKRVSHEEEDHNDKTEYEETEDDGLFSLSKKYSLRKTV